MHTIAPSLLTAECTTGMNKFALSIHTTLLASSCQTILLYLHTPRDMLDRSRVTCCTAGIETTNSVRMWLEKM
jgi:hypothetical protein